jgi:hypothetical protein
VSSWSRQAACPARSATGSLELTAPTPPSPAKDHIATISIFVGCFMQKAGLGCLKAHLGFITSQSRVLENFYKFVENSEKYKTNFVGFRERNPTTFVILTNVKNLDLS